MSFYQIKSQLAGGVFSLPGAFGLAMGLQRLLWGNQFFRVVNYHETPSRLAGSLESQLRFYARYFEGASFLEFQDFLQGKRWGKKKPGLLVTFDDGLRSQFAHALPLVEKYGFSACFMVPSGFVGGVPLKSDLPEYACPVDADEEWGDGRHMVSAEELRSLRPVHGIASHTINHARMFPNLPPEVIRMEVEQSKEQLEVLTERTIDAFCWVGGEPENYHPEAMKEISRAGYRFGFMTCSGAVRPGNHPLQVHRINVEADEPLSLVKFQLSGMMDLFHRKRRREVNRRTALALADAGENPVTTQTIRKG